MTLRLERPLAVIDVETTGADPKTARVVELAVVMLHPDGEVQEDCKRINPGVPIPAEATEVHGIAGEDVRGCPRFAAVAEALRDNLLEVDLCGYNAQRFDVPVMAAEFERCELKWPAPDQRIVDPFAIFKRQYPLTLETAVRHYLKREHEGAHGAAADARATLDVLLEQVETHDGGSPSLDRVIELGRDPSWLDADGKVARDANGNAVLTFGKWAGTPVHKVDVDYLQWMAKADFPADTIEVLRAEYAKAAKGAT